MLYAHHKTPSVGLFVLLLLVFSGVSHSQSGRPASKLPSPPIPAAVEAPTANSTSSAAPAPRKTRLLVARQTTHKHLQSEDVVFSSFVRRLNEFTNVECLPLGDMKQSQAAARARTETINPVVIVTFDIDSYAGGTIILNSQDLEIEYFLFAPRTGKKQTQGKVYFQGVGSGRLRKSNWPNGTPVKMTPDAAGVEAAESLFQWLLLAAAMKKPAP